MGKWVRVKDDSGVEKVSLVVRRDADPEVYEWLQSIPYGKANAYIKSALRSFIQEGRESVALPRAAARAPAPPVPPSLDRQVIAPAPAERHGAASPAPLPETPGSQLLEGVDADTLAVMQEMDGRF